MGQTTTAARVQALRGMTIAELRAEYRKVFGEETRSRHKEFLWKQIAWRIQALEEGDLSERARRRAAELARDADMRVRVPRDAFKDAGAPPLDRTQVHTFSKPQDVRLPMPGAVLTREYRGRLIQVTVLDEGFECERKIYRSLSAIAREVTGTSWNGYAFFARALAGGPATADGSAA